MERLFDRFANAAARAAGNPITFIACVVGVLAWAVSGPLFGFSETWQLVINTSTTIITFLMVFLIQNTQNRDNEALQAKLDELIRANPDAKDEYIGIEKLTDSELEALQDLCVRESSRAENTLKEIEHVKRSRNPGA